ncbi:zinc finger protein 77 [Lutzomyia longipalpis]|uniref:zinc finger protein 77 n=1 Tax=Lutzomyia longipalpis TaxID=7200 RepID=UPI0024839D4D|nr:zinc finger protein 77 [Lutzomyia longipalpis]
MFPIIPHHVVKSVSPCEEKCYRFSTFPGRSRVGGGNAVKAGHFVPRNCTSKSFSIIQAPNFDVKTTSFDVVASKGHLQPTDKSLTSSGGWIRMLQPAKDVHSSNIVLELTDGGSCVNLRTTKNISQGEDLQLWFSEEILAFMQIPFLSPISIQGQNRYTCHICERVFEDPNPLKIHLATFCEKHPVDILWNRLNFILTSSFRSSPPSPPAKTPLPTATDTSTTGRFSAFRPVPSSPRLEPPSPPPSAAAAAAHLETIVSNMGSSKAGHICVYCGKLYSRKYGLKIHIRTHTGFKPLKCKFCLRPFGDPSNLNKHVRLHSQANSVYKCHICDKVLVRRRDLQRHIQSRHCAESQEISVTMSSSSSSEDLTNI